MKAIPTSSNKNHLLVASRIVESIDARSASSLWTAASIDQILSSKRIDFIKQLEAAILGNMILRKAKLTQTTAKAKTINKGVTGGWSNLSSRLSYENLFT